MADREKVIRGLAQVSEYTRAKADIAGAGKGKEIFDSWFRAVEDAIALLREQEPVEPLKGDHMVMDLNNTIKTFECCTQKPPDCANCPEKGPGFGFACKQDMIENVLYWLKTQVPAVPGIVDDVVVRIPTKIERH